MDVRLYCFAHAGAGVSGFGRWPRRCGPGVEVVPVLLPGRDSRRHETRPTGRRALLDALFDDIAAAASDGPYVFYGHSLGGMVAHTLTRALLDAGLPGPRLLAVGACPAPHTVRPPAASDDDISDEQLLRFVGDVGSAPGGTLAEPDSVWHRAVLPVLRDDLRLARSLRAAALDAPGRLPVPVLAVGGSHDPVVTPQALDAWRQWTDGTFVRRTVPGDHFFVRGPELPRLVGRACRVVARIDAAAAPTPLGAP
ncbi:thioesterase II family protein [Streptomyces xanthii]|uniref:Thioesterase n=1 Tax=Streptomyces xanthii TaxID=2768069 RepID=A0A7H1BKI2_9ACTN|nr:thioesterase domain-containing protein [Streptomyces xanthii]QNS09237.1 thioesterase [Streptomyces xanthii]